MRRWLAILLLLFAAAVVQADEIFASEKCSARMVCAELSSADQTPAASADLPLFAVTTASPVWQMYGSGSMVFKGKHSVLEYLNAPVRLHMRTPDENFGLDNGQYNTPVMARRPADRYVFALRKIII